MRGKRGASYLFDVDGNLDLGHILGDVSFQRWNVNWLSHDTGHCEDCKEEGEGVSSNILRGEEQLLYLKFEGTSASASRSSMLPSNWVWRAGEAQVTRC